MGGAASKAKPRKLPTRSTPAWAGARTDPAKPTPMAFESKNEGVNPIASFSPSRAVLNVYVLAVQKDAIDPHFMANLDKVGQVRVDRMTLTGRQEPVSSVALSWPSTRVMQPFFLLCR